MYGRLPEELDMPFARFAAAAAAWEEIEEHRAERVALALAKLLAPLFRKTV